MLFLYLVDFIMINRQKTIQYSYDRNKRHKMDAYIKGERMGWQPFCFVECFDIKLEEVFSLCTISTYLHIQRVL